MILGIGWTMVVVGILIAELTWIGSIFLGFKYNRIGNNALRAVILLVLWLIIHGGCLIKYYG